MVDSSTKMNNLAPLTITREPNAMTFLTQQNIREYLEQDRLITHELTTLVL